MTAPTFPTSAATPYYEHDRTATLDYGWGFSELIVETDTVVSATFVLEMRNPGGAPVSGATLVLAEIVNTAASGSDPQSNVVYGWLAIQDASLVGKRLAGTCTYTTAQGRTDKRTMWFTIT
jgi:hypothetical protein